MSAPDGRSARARAQRAARRRQILDAALQVFAEHGYHRASVTHLVEAAGIARGTFYQYFDGKQAVFLELLDRLQDAFRGTVTGVDVTRGAPVMAEQVTASVVRILDAAAGSRALATVLFREAVGLDDVVDARVTVFESALHAYLRASLDNGIALGWLRPHDTEVVATCIYGSIRQLIAHYVVDGDGAFDREAVAREVVTLHLDGLAPPGG